MATLLVLVVFVIAAAPRVDATGPPYYGPAVLANPDLVGYWPLDETSGTTAYDQTSSPANGTYTSSGVTLGGAGAIQTSTDYAPSFSGAGGYMSVASASKLRPSASLTVELWFKSSTATEPIVQLGSSGCGASLKLSSGYLEGEVGCTTIESANTYDDGAWHYVVLTWDGSKATLYVDGALAKPENNTGNPASVSTVTFGGSYALLAGKDTASDYFSGSIDEVAVYGSDSDSSAALAAGEVANHYAAALTGPVETPVDVVAPTVSGSPLVGSTLAVTSPGSWDASSEIYGALSYTYQWFRCGFDGTGCGSISGATSSSYTVQSADNGSTLAVEVTAADNSANATTTVNLPAIGGYRSQVLLDGGSNLRGYWPLDETYSYPQGQPAVDISPSPADGAYSGSSPGLALGETGAIADGTDRAPSFVLGEVSVPAETKLQPSASLTIEFWFKTTGANEPIMVLGNPASSPAVVLKLLNGYLWASVGSQETESSNTYNDGSWHYAVLTWGGSQMALFVDGALAKAVYPYSNPANYTGTVSYSGSSGLVIGYDSHVGGDDWFDGEIDEVALYGSNTGSSGALTAAEIANHYRLASFSTLLDAETTGGQNPAIPGLSCGCLGAVGDPVSTATGDFVESATDASVATYGPPLSFKRTYDALSAQQEARTATPGPLGYGWTDNWNMSLADGTNVVTITQADGSQVNFYPPVSGSCQRPYVGPGTSGTYCALPDVTASLTYDSGNSTYTFITHPYESYTFNSSGQLTGESGPGGAAVSITYNAPSPGSGSCPSTASSCTTITSASGRTLALALNSTGEVTKVVDPLGRSWTYAYSSNNLVSVTDPKTQVTSYTYDGSNSNASLKHDLLTITKPNGQSGGPDAGDKVVNSYDSTGRVTSQTDAAGNETTIDYSHLDSGSGSGWVIATDPDGNETKTTYQNGVIVDSEAGYGLSSPSTTELDPDPSTLLDTSIVDPDEKSTEFAYNGSGDTTSNTNQLNQTATYTYNSFDEQTCAATAMAASPCSSLTPPDPISPGGTIAPATSAPPAYVTFSEYDTNGNLVWTTTGDYNPGDDSASQIRTTYNLYNDESVTLDGNNDSCTNTAPSSSLPCATIDPNGVVTQLGYDSAGDLTSSSTPDGNSGGEVAETTYGYDGDGERTTVTTPNGNLAGAIAANFTTTTAYDDDGEVMSVTVGYTGDGYTARETSYGYDGDGNRTSVTDPRDKTTTYTFNADDEQTLVTDPDSQSTLTCYDGDGHIAETVPAAGVAADSLTVASCPTSYPSGYGDRLAGDATTDTYNYQGLKTTETTPAPAGLSGDETTTYAYDATGRVTSISAPPTSTDADAPNQVTEYTYDDAGELLTATSGYGTSAASTTSYCYDPEGDKTAVVAPDGNTSGVPICSTSAPYETSSDYQTGYSYDSLGELVSKTRPATTWASSGQTTSYTYDPAGNVLTGEDANGVTTTSTYTPLNQLASISYSDSTPSVTYTYDANGNRVGVTDGTGTSSYVYDPFNELTSYENGASNTVYYSYDADGNTTGITYPLGSPSWASTQTVSYGYDAADELSSISDFDGNTIDVGNTADGLPNSLSLGSTGDTIGTSYDAADAPEQITLSNGSSTLLEFFYSDEPSGAIASETDTPTWDGSPAAYTYDAQGRVTEMAPGTDGTLDYGFDASGSPTTLPTGATGSYDDASELSGSTLAGTTTDYTYNADGERTQESQGGSAIATGSYDAEQRLTAYDNILADMSSVSYDGDGLRQSDTTTPTGGSAITENFTWNPTTSTPQLLLDSDNAYIYGPSNTPIEQVNLSTGAVKYLVSDALGSVRGVVNGSDGSLTASTAYDAWGNPETAGGLSSYTPFGYAGAYTDATGLSYLINRYYDPATGQFLTVDPAVDKTDQAYAYVGGDPVDNTDPLGLGCFLGTGCSFQNAVSSRASTLANVINPWSTSNLIRRWAASGSWTADALYLNPAYAAVAAYGAEAQAYESGCPLSQVAGYGLEGTFFLGLNGFGDEGEAAEIAAEEGLSWAEQSGILRAAARGKGNFGLGSATSQDADVLGRAWVGENYTVASDGRTLVSESGLRQYRPPSYKPNLGRYQANFEQRFEGQLTRGWQSNGHLNVTDLP